MQFKRGQIVRSAAGRDKGYYLTVVGFEDGNPRFCDGKERPLERPKSKNIKHIQDTGEYLAEAQMATDRAIRRALREYAQRHENSKV